jgi:neutral trehalase
MFVDYVWRRPETALPVTAAGLFPLFLEVADRNQAAMVAQTVRRRLFKAGGVATTLRASREQWDYPTAGPRCSGLPSSGSGTTANGSSRRGSPGAGIVRTSMGIARRER